MTVPPPASGIEQERYVLQAAMTECRGQLASARRMNDDLAVDLLEDDLNAMIERWAGLTSATSATQDTGAPDA